MHAFLSPNLYSFFYSGLWLLFFVVFVLVGELITSTETEKRNPETGHMHNINDYFLFFFHPTNQQTCYSALVGDSGKKKLNK